jgi:hypothetical protein
MVDVCPAGGRTRRGNKKYAKTWVNIHADWAIAALTRGKQQRLGIPAALNM